MKRAQAYVVGPAPLEVDEVAHHLYYVGSVKDPLYGVMVNASHNSAKLHFLSEREQGQSVKFTENRRGYQAGMSLMDFSPRDRAPV